MLTLHLVYVAELRSFKSEKLSHLGHLEVFTFWSIQGVSEQSELTPFTSARNTGLTYDQHVHCTCIMYIILIIIIIDDETGNVLFFQLQFGTYLPTFRLDALAILRVRMETSYETD